MSWLESLTSKVKSAVAPILQSPPVRMAGRALESTYARPMIGFKPELAGVIVSEFLPEENAGKQLLDAALYLASGPLNTSLGLAGSTPQGDDPYSRWKQLGYTSREDMVNRGAVQQSLEAARKRSVYIADDYGPPRPVRYPSGQVLLGDYVVKRFDPPEEKSSLPPAPPQDRPVEERRPPVSETLPPTSTPSPEERTQENDLARFYAKTHMRGSEMAQGGELQRRLWESGEMRGMTPESFMSWVEANPGLAYREAYRRGLLPEYETDSFK